MSAQIPPEVAKTISRLRSEAKDRMRMADELERAYMGSDHDPKQSKLPAIDEGNGFLPNSALIAEPTVENLIQYLRKNGGRVSKIANVFRVPETKIQELVAASGGKIYIPDWRGWVKLKGK